MKADLFKIGALIRFIRLPKTVHDPREDNPVLLIVRRIDGTPDGKYWDWECISGCDGREIIQSHEEWMYEPVK